MYANYWQWTVEAYSCIIHGIDTSTFLLFYYWLWFCQGLYRISELFPNSSRTNRPFFRPSYVQLHIQFLRFVFQVKQISYFPFYHHLACLFLLVLFCFCFVLLLFLILLLRIICWPLSSNSFLLLLLLPFLFKVFSHQWY